MNWVGKSLSQKVKIEMFSLHMTLSNHDADAFHVDRWIQFVTTNHNLQVLLLDFTMTTRTKKYVLHDLTNVAASLAFLMLRNCELRRPFFAFFLKDLSLTSVSVCGNHIIENLLSSCHLLQRFHIVDCLGTNKLRVIDLPCLKAATIKGVSMIQIVRLPNLEKLEYACLGPSTLEVIDCNNLKEFCFLEYGMTEEQTIEQFSSKFPFLEKLKLQRLKKSSKQLKRLSLLGTRCETLEELMIDCPNLRSYKYRGVVIPSIFSINTSCLQYVTLAPKPHTINNTQWFLRLRKYLANFKQVDCLKLWLFIKPPDQEAFSMMELKDESIPPPLKLKQLEVHTFYRAPSLDYTSLIDGLLWSSYPETISICSEIESIHSYQQPHEEFVKVLYKKLEDREENPECCNGSHIKCWRHHLKAFKCVSSSQKIDEQSLHHNTLNELFFALEIGNSVKFILTWEFSG